MWESAKIGEQLPENRRIQGNAYWLACGLTRQPSDGSLVKLPLWIFSGKGRSEPVELAQGKLRAAIPVAETSLEAKETVQLAGDRAEEDHLVHLGTGSPTLRRRFSATRM
jgi:hypothetical protein